MILSPHTRRSVRGYSLVSIMVGILITGILLAITIPDFRNVIFSTKSVAMTECASLLNRSSDEFVSTHGIFPANCTAEEALTLLQTPVDEVSKKAGVGVFTVLDPRWTLTRVDASSTVPCLAYSFNSGVQRPSWTAKPSGEGYVVSLDKGRVTPEVADWSPRLSKLSGIGAVKSKWVWDYSDVTRQKDTGDAVTVPVYNTSSADLEILGPDTISSPGNFSWDGSSTKTGLLEIALDGGAVIAEAGARMVRSSARTFVPGESGQVVVSLTLDGEKTITKLVPYSIAPVPSLVINGPDTVTTADPVTWTADSDVVAYPVSIALQSKTYKAMSAKQAVSDPVTFPWFTKTTVLIDASATNSSGVGRATKEVEVCTAGTASLGWVLDPQITGGKITKAGSYTFTLNSLPVDTQPPVSGAMNASVAPFGSIAGNTVSTNGTSTQVSVTIPSVGSNPLTGTLELSGDIASALGASATRSLQVPVDIAPETITLTWTVKVVAGDPSSVRGYSIIVTDVNTGKRYPVASGGAGAEFTVSITLPDGVYKAEAWATLASGFQEKAPEILNFQIAP